MVRTAKPVTSVESIVAALGSEIIPNESMWQKFFMVNGHRLSISANGDKYVISVCSMVNTVSQASHFKSDELWGACVHSVQVTSTRPAADIAKDVLRRIEWDKIVQYKEKFLEEEERHREVCASSRELAEIIAGAAGAKIRQTGQTVFTININGDWYSMPNDTVVISGNSMELGIRGVKNVEMMKELVAVLAKYRK